MRCLGTHPRYRSRQAHHNTRPSPIHLTGRFIMSSFHALRYVSPLIAGVALASVSADAAGDGPGARSASVADQLSVFHREDVRSLPLPLRFTLARMAGRPHTYN